MEQEADTEEQRERNRKDTGKYRHQRPKNCKPEDTQQDQGPREMGSATKTRKHREEDGERDGWSGRVWAKGADPIGGGGFWKLPQMAVGGGSETITCNPARKQKQVACGHMSHCDSASSLGTVTPSPKPLCQPWSWPPSSPKALSGSQTHPHPTAIPLLQEDTATTLQRLVELTAPRVTPVRNLHVQYRLIRKLGSGSYGRVLLARPRQGGEFGHQKADSRTSPE